jgi:MarR family transcriptional regulator, lower aerobic nicotinate degradation pathway regulator
MSSRAAGQDITVARATDRPGDLSPFRLGLLLRRAHDRAASALTAAVRPQGIGLRHFAVLIELANHSPRTQKELNELTGLDKATIVRVVDDLEKCGYAVRRPVVGDRRLRAVELTEAGLKAFDEAHIPAHVIAEDLNSHMMPGEEEQLVDLLTRYTYPDTTTAH